MSKTPHFPLATDITLAHQNISAYIHRTPILSSAFFNAQCDASLFFKCENFQKAGAFKSRGAINAVLSLSQNELEAGVATHSSGNHAQALARAAKILGTKAYIVMPRTAPAIKVAAVKAYGGEVYFCEPNQEARETKLAEVVAKTGATFIHPYNDYRIITGQATACKEILEEIDCPDYIFCPVGGGGLLSGTALSAAYWSPKTKVIGCEPQGADDAFRSFQSKKLIPMIKPDTVADGLLTSLGSLTFPIIQENVHAIFCVNDTQILEAMRLVWERMKIIIEPSAAVPLAVALSGQVNLKNKKAVIIFSGGNVDLNNLLWA